MSSVIGGILGEISSELGDYEEAQNLLDDANFYTEQARQARISGIDKARIRTQRLERETGELVARTAKSGVDLRGSPMTTLIEVFKRGEEDLGAIKRGADISVGAKLGKSRAARHQARYIRYTIKLRGAATYWSGGGGSALTRGTGGERPADREQEIPESEKLGPRDRSEGERPIGYDD